MISICIPAFDQYGYGVKHLEHLLKSIKKQSFTDYEICISDNSGTLKELALDYGANYKYNNEKYGVSANTNSAISMAKYDIIKPMYMDDWFDNDCLHEFVTNNWKVSGFTNYNENGNKLKHIPKPETQFYSTENRIGMPSVISFRKHNSLKFNEELKMVLDIDFYYQLFNLYGLPIVINDHNIGQRLWHKQQSSLLAGISEKIPTLVKKMNMRITAKKQFYGQMAVLHGVNIKISNDMPQYHLEILADKMPHLVDVVYDVEVKKKQEPLTEPTTQQPTTLTSNEQPKEEPTLSEVLPGPTAKRKGRKPKTAN